MGATAKTPGLVLLYDGLCGFCNGVVQFILRHDRSGAMFFAPLQGTYARDVVAQHPELHRVDSMILVKRGIGARPEQFAVRSEAVLQIAEYLGGGWRATSVLRIVPAVLRDGAYDRFAGLRYRLFGRYAACAVPSADVMARFLP